MPQMNINGARHYYRLEGDTTLPAIVLVHPIGADLGLWDKLVPLLTDRFCVLRYDLRGHGGSESTPGDYSVDLLARDVLGLVEGLGLSSFVACGVSLGGLTSLQVALLAPERVRALILCSVLPKMAPPPGGWDGRAKQAMEGGMAPLAGPMVERMFSARFKEAADPAISTVRNTFLRMDPAGYASACAALRDTDLTHELARVAAPTLVVNGEADPLIQMPAGQAMAAAIGGARHLAIPCGHFPPVEDSQAFADAVASMVPRKNS